MGVIYVRRQCAKKVVSDSPGLAGFPVELVDSVHHLSNEQERIFGKIFEEIQITEDL